MTEQLHEQVEHDRFKKITFRCAILLYCKSQLSIDPKATHPKTNKHTKTHDAN